MTGALDKLEHWRFGDVPLAVESASVKIGFRSHQHVYPHSSGAAKEKQGRKLYEIDVSGVFDENLPSATYKNPLNDAGIMRMCVDNQLTRDLVIPWIGTVQADCEDFELTERNTVRSGLGFHAHFVENMNGEFPIQQFMALNRRPMKDALIDFGNHGWKADIFSVIANAVGFVLGIKDQADLYSSFLRAKLDYLEGLFRQADDQAKELRDPANVLGLQYFLALWDTVRTIGNDISEKGIELKTYTTPIDMTIQQVATAIYQDSSRSGDLLGLNPIENTLDIPAGSKIRYYDTTE